MPSSRFLFWNIDRKPIAGLIADLAEEHQIDVVILAESQLSAQEVLQGLNRSQVDYFECRGTCKRISVFTRFDSNLLHPTDESPRHSIRYLQLPGRQELILAAAHLPSKQNQREDSQIFECVELGRRIRDAEEKRGHTRTVLVGDLNVNPFEPGIVGTEGLHATNSLQQASLGSRVVKGKSYRFFYNPMWSLFGDLDGSVPGSYFYPRAEAVCYHWNLFDQVLLRPALCSNFKKEHLRILSRAGEQSLLTGSGIPHRTLASDHLPLYFELEF